MEITYCGITVSSNTLTYEEMKELALKEAVKVAMFPVEPTEADYEARRQEETLAELAKQAKIDFRNLPDWATWTGAEAADALRTGILNGMTKTEARAAIDAQFAGVTNLATLGAATVAVLKTLADAVIDGRDIGHQNEAKAIMFLRDIVVR